MLQKIKISVPNWKGITYIEIGHGAAECCRNPGYEQNRDNYTVCMPYQAANKLKKIKQSKAHIGVFGKNTMDIISECTLEINTRVARKYNMIGIRRILESQGPNICLQI